MLEGGEGGERQPRERPSHWVHPVNERRRQGRARSHRRRRVALLLVLLVAVALTAAYLYLTSDSRVKRFAEGYLHEILGAQASIKRASFSWSEGLVLEDVRIQPPAPFGEPVMAAQRVDLKIRPLSLLLLAPEVTEIVVHQPEINLVLWDEKQWNFQALAGVRAGTGGLKQRPVVALEEGTLRIERKVKGIAIYKHQMRVSGLLLPSETDPDTFRFQTDVKSPSVHVAVASGQLDGQTGALSFEGQASNIPLTQPVYSALPPEAQRLWDRFDPKGWVNLKLRFDEKLGFQLVTDLTGVSFSDTYAGQEYKFENLTGRCEFSQAGLVLSGLQGQVNGTPVRLDGRMTGFDTDGLGLDFTVQADHVDFQESRAGLMALAPSVAALYDTLSPKGQVDVALKIHRDTGKDARVQITGSGYCRDIGVTYKAFPYAVERLHGTVHFDPEGFQIAGLEGYHGQSVVRLEGWSKHPGTPHVESDMFIHGRRVLLDDDLRAALRPAERKVFDQFVPAPGETLGSADAEVEVYTPSTPGARSVVTVQLNLLDCRLKYKGFPYLLTETTGRLNIRKGRTDIVDVRGRHGPATIGISGQVLSPDPDQPADVALKIDGRGVLLDEDLEAALTERDRRVMKAYHISGPADIAGTVTSNAANDHKPDYDMTIDLKDASMIYEAFPLKVEQIAGRLHLARGQCRIDSLSGYNRGARIEAGGWIDQRADDYAMDIRLRGRDVTLGESLRGALPQGVRAAWSRINPQGQVDIDAHLVKALGPNEPIQHEVTVLAKDAQARLDFFPYPLEHVAGELKFTGSEVRLNRLTAVGGQAEFSFDGTVVNTPLGPKIDLALRAKGLRLEGPLRDALPAPMQRAFDGLHPTGRVDLNLTQLLFEPTGPNTAVAAWTGSALLDEVGLDLGMKAAGLVGTAVLSGRWDDGKVAFQGGLRLQQGRVADKALTDTRFQIEKAADADVLVLRNIEGRFYGGRIEGSASVQTAPAERYALTLAAEGVDFERLLREGFRVDQDLSGGRLKGTLGLRAGDAGVEASGYVDVTDAKLYELPMIVRVLNALRLAPDDRTAFEKARILYFVRGKRLFLGDVRLEGKALSLYGAGVLEPDGQLHLTFLTGKKDDDPLVPALYELAEGLRRELVVVMVTGTLAQPKIEVRTLSTLTAPFRELIQLVREQRAREAVGKRR
jgi:hypothetical protein